jgi:hypothetical protein
MASLNQNRWKQVSFACDGAGAWGSALDGIAAIPNIQSRNIKNTHVHAYPRCPKHYCQKDAIVVTYPR